MIDCLGFCVGGGSGRNWLGLGMPATNRLVLRSLSIVVDWFCLNGRHRLDFSMGDRTWRDFSLGFGIDLFCVGGSKMTCFSIWIQIELDFVWCSTANRYGVLTDRCVCYVLEDHSVTVDWLAHWFIPYKRTIEVRASNSSPGCSSAVCLL